MSGDQKSYLESAVKFALGTIYYSRGARTWTNSKNQKYLRGVMVVRGLHVDYVTYDTIERMDGTVWLKPGLYHAAMEISVDKRNPGRRQIRPAHSQRNDKGNICNFLIHPSAPPHFLEGCVAPGHESARGLEASKQSLETIFLSLGGFEPGKPVLFDISGVMPTK